MNQPQQKLYTLKEIADGVGKSKQAVAKLLKKLEYEAVKLPPTTANQLPPTTTNDRQLVTGNHHQPTANQNEARLPKRGTLFYTEEAKNAVYTYYNVDIEAENATANHRQPVTANQSDKLPVTTANHRQPINRETIQEKQETSQPLATPGPTETMETVAEKEPTGPKIKDEAGDHNIKDPLGSAEAVREILKAKDETIEALKDQLEHSKGELSEKNATIAKLIQNLATEQATVQRLQTALNNSIYVRGIELGQQTIQPQEPEGAEGTGTKAKEPEPEKVREQKKSLLYRLKNIFK